MTIVEQAIGGGAPLATEAQGKRGRLCIVGYDSAGHPVVRVGWKTVAQVAADLKVKFTDGVGKQISSTNIIRQARDSR